MRRRRRGANSAKHLSLSATDAHWEPVRAQAAGRGLSIARYVMGLVERDAARARAGAAPPSDAAESLPAPDSSESPSAPIETVRALLSRLEDEVETASRIASMRRDVAALFEAWALGRVRAGRGDAVRAALAPQIGEDAARRFLARIEARGRSAWPAPTPSPRRGAVPERVPDQGTLFR